LGLGLVLGKIGVNRIDEEFDCLTRMRNWWRYFHLDDIFPGEGRWKRCDDCLKEILLIPPPFKLLFPAGCCCRLFVLFFRWLLIDKNSRCDFVHANDGTDFERKDVKSK
jgi:hypothetical protein